jgi:hypothetical protein
MMTILTQTHTPEDSIDLEEEMTELSESDCSELSSAHSDDSTRYAALKALRKPANLNGTDDELFRSPPVSWSCLKLPGNIVPEAFDPQPHRVPRQLAAVTGLSLEVVMRTFDDVLDNPLWRTQQRKFSMEEIVAFANRRGAALHIFHGSRPVHVQHAEGTNCKTIVATYWSGNWYFLKDVGKAVAAISVREPTPATSTAILVTSLRRPTKEEPFTDEFPWHQDLANISPGRYWVHSSDGKDTDDADLGHTIEGAVKHFVNSGRFPLISWARYPSHEGCPADKPLQLTYHKTAYDGEGQRGSIVVKSMARDAHQNRAWAERLNVPYGGQSVGSFAVVVLDTLLKRRPRHPLSQGRRLHVMIRQKGKCAGCDDELGDAEIDHIIPLCKGGLDDLSNMQALCRQCHGAKSAGEGSASLGYLKSRFNQDTFQKYLLSPAPPCMIFKDPGIAEHPANSNAMIASHLAVDIIGSRRNALYQATELPVFTPLDDIEHVGPEKDLPDMVYVDKPFAASDLATILAGLPYHGPGWYSKIAIQYCLRTHKLTWQDLRYGLMASGRVPGDEVRAAIDEMDAAWEGIVTNSPNDRPAKRSINSMVGVFGMKPGGVQIKGWISFKNEAVTHRGFEMFTTRNAFGLPGLISQRTAAEVRDPSSYRPLYDLCLCTEHVRLAQCYHAVQAVYKVQRLPPNFLSVTVDGLIWTKPRKNVTAELMKTTLEGFTFENTSNLEEYLREQLVQPEPQQKRLRTSAIYPLTCTAASPAPVVRVEHPKAKQHLRGIYDPRKCARNWHFDPPCSDWQDLEVEEAISRVSAGESIFIRGIAGTGKSHIIRETLIPALRAQGKRVIALAKTHAAAAVAEGDTCDHFAWKHVREGGTGVEVIWVDEISMLDIELLCDLNHVSFRDPPPQWILSGDFNQYTPFFNAFRGQSFSKSFEGSSLLRNLAGGNRLTLTQCRRSDAQLFAFYSSLIPGGARHERPLADIVIEARQTYHASKASGFLPGTALSPTNLVLSHKLRVELNLLCNVADAQGREGVEEFTMEEFFDPEELENLDTHKNQPQKALFWPGLVVMACCSGRKLKNALPYEIVAFEGDLVTLRMAVEPSDADDDGSGVSIDVVLTRRKFFSSMRLRYALTYASVQGVTIKTLLALHDTSHTHFDVRKLFVGTSRATANNLLVVY